MLKNQIESLLFIAGKPLTIKKIAELTDRNKTEVEAVLDFLKKEYNNGQRGLRIIANGDEIQLVTGPESAEITENFLKQELTGEITRPQLEALTIIAYRGPITKYELELIRGVNCSLILRNLLIRGLIESFFDKKKSSTLYQITLDFLRHLGLNNVNELPDYAELSSHQAVQDILAKGME